MDGNNRLQPLDALLIINVLNRQSGLGQGEPAGEPAGEPEDQGGFLIMVGSPPSLQTVEKDDAEEASDPSDATRINKFQCQLKLL